MTDSNIPEQSSQADLQYDSARVVDENMLSTKDIPRGQEDTLIYDGYKSNLKPNDIAQMLTWAMADDDPTSVNDSQQQEQAKREALNDLLALTLAEIESSSDVLSRLCVTVHPDAMVRIGLLLETKDVPLSVFRQIKDYAKQLTKIHPTGPEHEAAMVLYYVAIAASLVHHEQSISNNKPEKLQLAFQRCTESSWIPDSLNTLFQMVRKQRIEY